MRQAITAGMLASIVRWLVLAATLACAPARAMPLEVSIPSADLSRGPGLMLKAFWYAAPASAPAPAVVLLHGCSGPYDKRGVLSPQMRSYAMLLNQLGMHALVVDSLTPRGEVQNCTLKSRTRLITPAHRRLDALSALEWLAARPDVDAQRLGLMGWANGGSAALAATNERRKQVAEADVKPAFAVAFYPGCEAELSHGYASQARLLLLVGEADDWMPAWQCKRLVAQAQGEKPQIEGYPGAPHGFDVPGPLRARNDVAGAPRAGMPVHEGGQPLAQRRSRERLLRFLREVADR
jgi:dienelactone hydrolase